MLHLFNHNSTTGAATSAIAISSDARARAPDELYKYQTTLNLPAKCLVTTCHICRCSIAVSRQLDPSRSRRRLHRHHRRSHRPNLDELSSHFTGKTRPPVGPPQLTSTPPAARWRRASARRRSGRQGGGRRTSTRSTAGSQGSRRRAWRRASARPPSRTWSAERDSSGSDEIVLTTHEEPLRRVKLFAEADMIDDLCDEEEEL